MDGKHLGRCIICGTETYVRTINLHLSVSADESQFCAECEAWLVSVVKEMCKAASRARMVGFNAGKRINETHDP